MERTFKGWDRERWNTKSLIQSAILLRCCVCVGAWGAGASEWPNGLVVVAVAPMKRYKGQVLTETSVGDKEKRSRALEQLSLCSTWVAIQLFSGSRSWTRS